MSRILITGGTGFVGKHLKNYLEKNDSVFVSSRTMQSNECLKLDLSNYDRSLEILQYYKFDKIFHLACQSSVHISWERPFETMNENILTTINLLKVCRKLNNIKLVIAGTSEIYQHQNDPLTEQSGFNPTSPYAISKLTIDYFVRLIAAQANLNVTILRLFNHIGPGQSEQFALSSFAKQLAEIKLGKKKNEIRVGNLNVMRDFLDVRDACVAYDLVSNSKEHGYCYNVCGGNAYSLADLLDEQIRIANVKVRIEVDENRLRRQDVSYYCGNYDKIKMKFNWEPKIPITKTLTDLFEYWMEKCKNEEN